MLPSQTDMFLPVLEFFVAVVTATLGFDPIFTRAKRYNSDSSIGLEIIQAFVGTLGSAKGGSVRDDRILHLLDEELRNDDSHADIG